MSEDLKRLCVAAIHAVDGLESRLDDELKPEQAEVVVRAVLEELSAIMGRQDTPTIDDMQRTRYTKGAIRSILQG